MKHKILPILFLMSFIFALAVVSSASTMNVPVTNTNYTTLTFNCTTTTAECGACLNASIYYNAAGGATGTYLSVIANDSVADVDFTSAISIEALSDALTYNFTCRMFNATSNVVNSTSVNSVGIDNTKPVISVERTGSSWVDYMTSKEIKCSATDATAGVSSTTRTLAKPSAKTVTASASPYTFTGGDLNELGTYTFTCSATDSASNSDSSTVTFVVQSDDDQTSQTGTDTTDDSNQSQNNSSTLMWLLIIFGIAAVIVIVIVVTVSD